MSPVLLGFLCLTLLSLCFTCNDYFFLSLNSYRYPSMGKQKQTNPFSAARLPNTFYFVRTHPAQYDPVNYFQTFSTLKAADIGSPHKYWTTVLRILLESLVQKYKDNGGRLKARWSLPDKGLGTFWDAIEEAESANDVLNSSSDNVRKCSLRSAERNILGAIQDINYKKGVEKRRRPPTFGKENEKPQSSSVDECKAPRVEVQGVEFHDVQDDVRVRDKNDDTNLGDVRVQDENGDTSQEDIQADREELLWQKTIELESELSRSIFYLTGNGSVDCSETLRTPWLVNL